MAWYRVVSIVYADPTQRDLPGELLVEVVDDSMDIRPALLRAVTEVVGIDADDLGSFRVIAP